MVVKVKKPKGSEEKMMCGFNSESRIAELAYFKAEQRGFAPGHEMDDWLEAEQECILNESNNPRVMSAI